MWIIVEGPDLAGKSTVVDGIDKELISIGKYAQRRHAGPLKPDVHPLDAYVVPMLMYRVAPSRAQRIWIDDRWHWGEGIYPHILGRKTKMDDGVMLYIEMFVRSAGGIIAYCNPGFQELRARYEKRGDQLVQKHQLAHIALEYRNLLDTLYARTINMQYNDPMDAIVRAEELELETQHLKPFVTYVGAPFPRLLLVGDKRSNNDRALAPAFMPYPGTSGHYLMNAMSVGMSRDKLASTGIINACDVDDVEAVWDAVGRPLRVIALGQQAHFKLRKLNIPHGVVPHPQFIRRFHHREQVAYGNLLDVVSKSQANMLGWRP